MAECFQYVCKDSLITRYYLPTRGFCGVFPSLLPYEILNFLNNSLQHTINLSSAATHLKNGFHVRDTHSCKYQSFNGMKINYCECTIYIIKSGYIYSSQMNDGVTVMPCRFGSYTVFRLFMTHAYSSRTLLLLPPNASLGLTLFNGRNHILDGGMSCYTRWNYSAHIIVYRHTSHTIICVATRLIVSSHTSNTIMCVATQIIESRHTSHKVMCRDTHYCVPTHITTIMCRDTHYCVPTHTTHVCRDTHYCVPTHITQ